MKKNVIRFFLFFLISTQLITSSYAATPEAKTLQDYKIDTEIFRNYELQKNLITAKVFKSFSPEEISIILNNLDDVQVEQFFYQKYHELVTQEDKHQKLTEDDKLQLFKLIKIKIRHITRQYGVGIAAVYFGITIAEQLLFIILINAGLPSIAIIIHTIPIADLFLLTSLQIKHLIKRQKIIKSYGGKKNYKIYLNLKKDLEQYYGLDRKNTIILTRDINQDLNSVIIKKDNILEKVLAKLELDNSNLSLNSMLNFCKEHKILKSCKSAIKSKSNQLKKIELVDFFLNAEMTRPEIKQKFLIQFDQFMKKVEHFYKNREFSLWAKDLLNAESSSDVLKSFESIPGNLTVFNVFEILKNTVIPYWLDEMDNIKYSEFRKFYKNFEKVELESHVHASEPWTIDWSHKILNY
jgi:hypothetical protein